MIMLGIWTRTSQSVTVILIAKHTRVLVLVLYNVQTKLVHNEQSFVQKEEKRVSLPSCSI